MSKFFEDQSAKPSLAESRGVDEPGNQTAIPVVQENLAVSKRVVETGQGIRVTKTSSEREEIVDELLARDDVVVERVSINQVVSAADLPGIRHEGQTMIVPILEEVLFVEKRTIIKEELRITSARREVRDPQKIVLRSEHVSIEHFDDNSARNLNLP